MKVLMALALTLSLVAGCSEKFEPPPKDESKSKASKPKSQPVAKAEPTPAPVKEEKKPPAPDPSDAKGLAEARNIAILEGRIDDAMRLCGKEALAKVDEQGVLACVLTACRKQDTATAKVWAKHLKGALLKEARKVCAANKVGPI